MNFGKLQIPEGVTLTFPMSWGGPGWGSAVPERHLDFAFYVVKSGGGSCDCDVSVDDQLMSSVTTESWVYTEVPGIGAPKTVTVRGARFDTRPAPTTRAWRHRPAAAGGRRRPIPIWTGDEGGPRRGVGDRIQEWGRAAGAVSAAGRSTPADPDLDRR